ncbi:MAG TPA: hypothetical protein VMX17_16005 [Candidatus Glassbacteria bacterium]|nr:hypothetical protein [Candidatus Glassbacteria bacterium]
MADINIKVVTDTKNFDKDSKKVNKTLNRFDKTAEKSAKQREKEAKDYLKLNKKNLEIEKKREELSKKAAIKAKPAAGGMSAGKGFSEAGKSLGVGAFTQAEAFMGVGMPAALGIGAGLVALSAAIKVLIDLFKAKSEMIKFGIAARLSTDEIQKLDKAIDNASITVGTSGTKIQAAVQGIFNSTKTMIPTELVGDLAKILKVTGQNADELEKTWSDLSKRMNTTDPKKILDMYIQLGARGGDVTKYVEGLDGAFKNLNLTNKNNVRFARELMFVFNVKTYEDLKKVLTSVGKTGKQLYKDIVSGKEGDLENLTERLAKLKTDFPKEFGHLSIERISVSTDAKKEMEDSLTTLYADPLSSMERLQSLAEIFVKSTVFPGIEAALTKLAKWMSTEDFTSSMIKTFDTFKNILEWLAKQLAWLGYKPNSQKSLKDIDASKFTQGTGYKAEPTVFAPLELPSSSGGYVGLNGETIDDLAKAINDGATPINIYNAPGVESTVEVNTGRKVEIIK